MVRRFAEAQLDNGLTPSRASVFSIFTGPFRDESHRATQHSYEMDAVRLEERSLVIEHLINDIRQ